MKQEINILNKYGFWFRVEIEYFPHFGFALARYKEDIISSVELYKLYPVTSDSDLDHETYQESFEE